MQFDAYRRSAFPCRMGTQWHDFAAAGCSLIDPSSPGPGQIDQQRPGLGCRKTMTSVVQRS